MSNVVPFEQSKLPAHLQVLAGSVISADDLTAGAGGGFPVLSVKGKVFHIVRGDERTLITRPDTDDEPAAFIEVVILRANPALSKTYYATGYTDGSEEKPTCYSNDGIAPAADAQEPQAQRCATCPNNQWGSKISENGSKIKACADFRRLAVASPALINDPMLLRVPAASLKNLREYGDALKKRGVQYPVVITRIGFDHTVAHPQLTFKPVGFVNEKQAAKVVEMVQSDIVAQIVGLQGTSGGGAPNPVTPNAAPTPLPNPAPKVETPAPTPKPAAKKAEPKAEPKPEPKPAAKPQAKVVEVDAGDLESELDRVLSAAGFDDVAA